MPKKTAPIPSQIWEKHKESIVTRYTSAGGTLEDTMKYMQEAHGFVASKNQYTAKLKAWGIRKNATNDTWVFLSHRQRKRRLESSKETAVSINGRTLMAKELSKEIARNVPMREQFTCHDDMPTPDGVAVFTPRSESPPDPMRDIKIEYLPYNQYSRWIYRFLRGMLHPSSTAPNAGLLTMDGSEAGNMGLSPEDLIGVNIITAPLASIPTILITRMRDADVVVGRMPKARHYLPPDYTTSVTTQTPGIHSGLASIANVLTELFHLSTNNLLPLTTKQAVACLVETFDFTSLLNLCRLDTPWMEIFRKRVLREALIVRNGPLVERLVDMCVHLTKDDYCQFLSLAVYRQDLHLVRLCCRWQRIPQIKHELPFIPILQRSAWDRLAFWPARNLDILNALISSGADPNTFVTDRDAGFALASLAGSGHLKAVELLLKAGAEVNAYLPGHHGTALQAATANGHRYMVELLIQYGADVNAPHDIFYRRIWKGWIRKCPFESRSKVTALTPIQIAAKYDYMDIVQILINSGAIIDACPISLWESEYKTIMKAPDKYCGTLRDTFYSPMQYAALRRDHECVLLLLSHGAHPDFRMPSDFGDTPLQIACRLGDMKTAVLLLQSGADVNAAPSKIKGLTALQAAAAGGHHILVDVLLARGASINAPPGEIEGFTAVQAAAIHGHITLLMLLWSVGGDLNAPPCKIAGRTVIQGVASAGSLEQLRAVISFGAAVNLDSLAPVYLGQSTLCAAISNRNLPMLQFLINNGAEVNESLMIPTMTPLGYASETNWLEGVQLLLIEGADVHALIDHDDGSSPAASHAMKLDCSWKIVEAILFAHGKFHTDCCPDLLAAAVVYAAREYWSDPPKGIEIFRSVWDKLKHLPGPLRLSQVQNAWDALIDSKPNIYIIKFLLDEGANINSHPQSSKRTMLQSVLNDRNKLHDELAFLLIDHGADINVPATSDMHAPLQAAIEFEHFEVVDILLQRGADVNAPPAEVHGRTALQAAAIAGLLGIAIQLLERGASVAAPAATVGGTTAINGAAEWGRFEMLQLLLQVYDGPEDLKTVCQEAACCAEKEGHHEIARWLRGYKRS